MSHHCCKNRCSKCNHHSCQCDYMRSYENISVKNNIFLQNKNVTYDILNIPNIEKREKVLEEKVNTLENEQYFKENGEGDIYTYKNVLIGTDKNIDTTNFYSKAISVNRVSESIKQYYDSIIYTNSIIQQILKNIQLIKKDGFEKVLRPYVENNYYENDDYFFVYTLSTSNKESEMLNNKELFTYKKFENYTNKTVGELITLNKEGKFIYYPSEGKDTLSSLIDNYNSFIKLQSNGLNELNYFSTLTEWDNGIKLYFKCIVHIPGILPNIPGVNPDYIVVGSGVQLNKIIEDIDQIKLFSPEYIEFIKVISNNMFVLQQIYNNLKKNIFDSSIQYDVWEYNTTVPSSSICYYSSIFKDFIGKRAVDCVILGTDINIAQIITYIFNFNSKNLLLSKEEEVGVIEFSYNNSDNVFLTKLVTLNGKKYLILNNIPINPFFNNAIRTNGDMTIEGAVAVNNYDGKNIFNLHTENQVLEVNGKIGINVQEPNALLDVQGISVTEMNTIVNQYSNLNKFIFSYYDYFINNFSTTENRNWNQIYQNYLNQSQISVTTINLPFDFKSTNSSDAKFSEFINNFNNYTYFGYTETEFKSQYEGKTASQIENPYFISYFNALKDYFLIMWNQKDYYLLNKYQSFTNIVNYFGGPVLRMQVMWYDEKYNVLRLFSSNLKLDKYLLNENLNGILSAFFSSLFSCEQLTNLYSNWLKDPIIQAEQIKNRLYITEYIKTTYYKQRFGYPQNGIFCWEYIPEDQSLINFFFTETSPSWAGNNQTKLQVQNQDLRVIAATNQQINWITKNYNSNIIERIMMTIYFFQFEYKISMVKIIEVAGKKHVIGSGVNILDFIKKNVLSNGDQQFNGSLRLIDPSSNQTVIAMDTTEKQVAIQYPVGLGTENPRSLLTIDDVSITNVFDYLDELSKKNRYITDLSKQLSGVPVSDYKNIIESYIDPFTGLKYEQNVDNYFGIQYPNNIQYNNILETQLNYHWYLKEWINVLYKNVLNPSFDPINNNIKSNAGVYYNSLILNTCINNNLIGLSIYNWIWGKKITSGKYFKDNLTNNLKYLYMGINFNKYFTRFNSNKNLQNIINASQALQIFLNELYLSYNNLQPLNEVEIEPFLNKIKKDYTKYRLGVIDYPEDFNQTRIYLNENGDLPTDLNNLRGTDTIYNLVYNFDSSYHGNLTFEQVLIFYQKIVNIQQKIGFYNGKESQLSLTDSNIIGYRTNQDYWIASWMYLNIKTYDNQSKNVLAIYEFNVDDYLNQSIQMIGDLQMAGNLTLMNPKEYLKYVKNQIPLSSLNPLVSIYPEEEFMGVGSQKIFTQYALNYKTIDLEANKVFAKNHVVVSNPYYPNLVGERIADPSESLSIEDSLKSSYSGFTVRRTTKEFTLDEIVNQGDGKFGIDISYEVEDKYEDSYEMAESGVKITGIKTFNNGLKYPIPTFFWNIVDNATNQDTIVEKTVMELDSESRLTVNKIKLGKYDLEAVDNGDGTQSLKWGNIILGTQ